MSANTYPVAISMSLLILELTIKGGHLSPNTYPVAISMLERQLLPMEASVYNTIMF